jgi:hypothetical protein
MAKSEDISLVKDGRDFYVVVDGVKVAKRGLSGNATGRDMGFDRARPGGCWRAGINCR